MLPIETLETRRFLSVTTIPGYTPAEIRKAYQFDQITLPGGITADGSGQTIAIVDAFNDPNIAADLNVFNTQFGLASANLQVVNQTGGSSLPTTDAGWAGEISLDVEWAHAIAPGAKILLVEANSDSLADLLSAVDYARAVSGVSTVSMSWGGSEFFSWNGGESSSELNYDPHFTTPAGHNGVTFIASAGDSGSQAGVQWPSISPNVISVGGTSLYTSDSAGTYYGEAGWSGTNGGFSQVEAEPAYQLGVQTTGVRTAPDVAYNADPNTGFAVYDSLAYQGTSGWQEVGGTSAGAPQWAALVAIADQARALSGQGTLDGATQTLPALYSMYAAPQSATYSTYTADFNDVATGGGTRFRWRWGGVGQSGYTANYGYDLVTGLGSPVANSVVSALAATTIGSTATTTTGNTGSTSSGSGSDGSTSGGTSSGGTTDGGTTTTPAPILPASPIHGVITSNPGVKVVGGDEGSINVKVINTGATTFNGPVTIRLYASRDSSLSADDMLAVKRVVPHVTLGPGKSRIITIDFTYPASLATGMYHLIASVDAPWTETAAAVVVAPKAVAVTAATVDLSTTFSKTRISVTPNQDETATVVLKNLGNVTATGTFSVNLYGSLDAILDGADLLLASVSGKKINLKPGKSMSLTLHFAAPTNVAGTYDLIAATASSTSPADSKTANDTAAAGTV